jgi:hypothetical protein
VAIVGESSKRIPLTEEERAAVEEGVYVCEKLCQKMADVPTPAGPTPLELAIDERRSLLALPACGPPG